MQKGTVKWFDPIKGYGFITPEGDSKDIFVHISAVINSGLKTLEPGDQLEFDIESSTKSGSEKISAKDISLISSGRSAGSR